MCYFNCRANIKLDMFFIAERRFSRISSYTHTLLQPKYNIQFKYMLSVLKKKQQHRVVAFGDASTATEELWPSIYFQSSSRLVALETPHLSHPGTR